MISLDKLASTYNRRAEFIEQLRGILHDDPGFANEVCAAVTSNGSAQSTASNRPVKSTGGTHADRLMAHLASIGNRWSSIPDLMKQTGLPRSGLANVVYKSHADQFDHKDNPAHKRQKLWRLKESHAAATH